MSFLRIRADEKPLSTIPLRTVIKIRQIPIKPYSAGESKRARTKPTTKEMPCPRKASAADQIVPLMVLPFSDEADIDGGYLIKWCCLADCSLKTLIVLVYDMQIFYYLIHIA